MSTALASQFTLSIDELQALGRRLGVTSYPVVLAIHNQHATVDELELATDRATRSLAAKGLIEDGAVDPDLAALVQALRRPERELSMRLVTPDGTSRVAIVRSGPLTTLTRKIQSEVIIRPLASHMHQEDVVQALVRELPQSQAAAVNSVGGPLPLIREALIGTHDPAVMADRLRSATAIDSQSALVMGSALGSRLAFGEIVYYELDKDDDRIQRAPAAVGVFYTKRGRVVSAPSISPNHQAWVTLKGGTTHSITQAIGQLIELLPSGWEGNR